VLEWGRRGFDEGTLVRRGMLRTAEAHLCRQVSDVSLRARLRPTYPLGCKRIIYSNDYFPALGRPNVELVTEPIARITPNGIVTADGRERPLDVLVCATGFDVQQLLSSLVIEGAEGRTLREAWAEGPEAHLGVTVSGFPNLFLMLGPNTATGHTSTLLYIEPEVRYAIACMQRVVAGDQRWIDVRPEVQRASNARLQQRLAGSVWTQCQSWYRADNGKVIALFPGFTREYQALLRRPDFAEYTFGRSEPMRVGLPGPRRAARNPNRSSPDAKSMQEGRHSTPRASRTLRWHVRESARRTGGSYPHDEPPR